MCSRGAFWCTDALCFLCVSRSSLAYNLNKIKNMSLQPSLSTEIDLLDDFDEENKSKKYLLLACVLVGEYLSTKDERPTFYVRK